MHVKRIHTSRRVFRIFPRGGEDSSAHKVKSARAKRARVFFTLPWDIFTPPPQREFRVIFPFFRVIFLTMRINALPNALGNALFPFGAEAQGGVLPPQESPRGGITPFTPPLCMRLLVHIPLGGKIFQL